MGDVLRPADAGGRGGADPSGYGRVMASGPTTAPDEPDRKFDRRDEEAALEILRSAKVEPPESFDGPAMMRKLHRIKRRHGLRMVAASNVDTELLGTMASAAKRLSTLLNKAEPRRPPHGAPDEAERITVTWVTLETALGNGGLAHLRCALREFEKRLAERLVEPPELPAFGHPNSGTIADLLKLYMCDRTQGECVDQPTIQEDLSRRPVRCRLLLQTGVQNHGRRSGPGSQAARAAGQTERQRNGVGTPGPQILVPVPIPVSASD